MQICASCGHEMAEDANFCPKCGAPDEAAPAREVRKTVTVIFCDITGSTELGESTDPEALRALLARYFERMKGIIESHGGAVEKFIGDAVMSVFGVPVAHEDDALRACRAAVEMREALSEMGIAGRIGVNTGEVVTGTEERLATGRRGQRCRAAGAGSGFWGGPDWCRDTCLGGEAVEVGEERALTLKGKGEPVAVYPLFAVSGELGRRFRTPMVGRERELQGLRDAFARAVHDGSCQLFTVLGLAGVGKSRLVYEFLSGLDAEIVRARCLSYGEGITYWPVVEALKQLDALPPDPAAAASLRSLLGETEQGTSAEAIAWGFRQLLEERASERPLVCVFDDIHWAEGAFLDLIEHIADLSRDAPILLLCLARPELLDECPGWGGGKLNATTVLLEPLSGAESEELLAQLGGADDAPGEIRDVLDQVEQRLLAPVQVVEDTDERPLLRLLLQQLAEPPSDRARRGCMIALAKQRAKRRRLLAGREFAELLQDLHHRPVGDPLPVREARSPLTRVAVIGASAESVTATTSCRRRARWASTS
jgi:AAA ATPase domain/Adenylate and Guanylate cyclase catalytic domain/zinc-ribbon domain